MTKRFNLICAVNRSGVIGVDGKIPWKFKEDMKHFKEVTSCYQDRDFDRKLIYPKPKKYQKGPFHPLGKNDRPSTPYKAVIMGYKTWSSLSPNRALPHRHNIVLSKGDWDLEDIEVVNSIGAACDSAYDYDEVWVIGGASIYKQFLEKDLISRMLITEVPSTVPIYGTKFPIYMPFETPHERPAGHFRINIHDQKPRITPSDFESKSIHFKNNLIVHDFRRVNGEEE